MSNIDLGIRLRELADMIDPPQLAVLAETRADAAKAMREVADLLHYGNCHYWCQACYAAVRKPEHRAPTSGVALSAADYLAKVEADPKRAAALQRARSRAATDPQWVQQIRETAASLRDNAKQLAKYPDMTEEARARELAALYVEEIADLYEIKQRIAAAGVAEAGHQVIPPAGADGGGHG